MNISIRMVVKGEQDRGIACGADKGCLSGIKDTHYTASA